MMMGLMGTGKSTVAREIARRWDMEYVSWDLTRKSLAGIAPETHRYEGYGEGLYTEEFSRSTYSAMLERARDEVRRCLQLRTQEGTSPSDGRWELFHRQEREQEPVLEVPPERHIILDTGGTAEDTVARALRLLFASVV